MPQAQSGDTVLVHYTGTLDDGTVFDSSRERDPLKFKLGAGQVVPGFEEAVMGMETGERKSTTLAPEQAYGPRRDEMVIEVGREKLPDNLEPAVGQRLQMQPEGGQSFVVKISAVSDETVTLDANHELAGQALTFDLELVEVL